MKTIIRRLSAGSVVLSLICMLTACSGGAVVFAPLPAEPDTVLYPYTHPGGVFALDVPPTWTVFTQYTTTLASASFAPPDTAEPVLTVGMIRLAAPVTPGELAALADRYQTQVRSDVDEYVEAGRDLLADGAWRMRGARILPGGTREPINTFIYAQADHLIVAETLTPADERVGSALVRALNSVRLLAPETLQPSDLTALSFLKPTRLGLLHVRAWTAVDGAFFITGEVANYGTDAILTPPVEAALTDAAGAALVGAVDAALGQGIPPGGFAPFSLRFGAQPPTAAGYTLSVGAGTAAPAEALVSADGLIWTDSFRYDEFGRLVVEGTVTNALPAPVRDVRAAVTVFDPAGGVIGAGWADVAPTLTTDQTLSFTILLPAVGGSPANYLVTVTALR